MIVKSGRYELDVNSQDVVLDNGACYQIITKKIGKGWDKCPARLAKAKAMQMIKDGVLVLEREEGYLKYYRFSI